MSLPLPSKIITKALVLMGGTGTRFGGATPKQYHRLAGKKIYLYTLEALLASNFFDEILLVVHPEWLQEVEADIAVYAYSCRVVAGGETRQESSYKGLVACGPETGIVLVHDAVRPFLTERILRENLQKAREIGAADTCIPSADTLVYAPDHHTIANIPERSHFFRGQTPQTFHYSLLLQAHQNALEKQITGSTDDCRLVRELGAPIAVVKGEEANIKITTELDLVLAEQLLALGWGVFRESSENYTIRDKLFAVTGANGGIGQAICHKLQENGARVLSITRQKQKKTDNYPVDLTSESEIAQCFQSIYEHEGELDGLINCAGVLSKKKLADHSPEEIDAILQVNLRAVILTCKYAHMKKGGHIVNVASSSHTSGRKDITVYAATKAAVVNFSQGLADERSDLIVDVVSPQRTDTRMRREHFPEEEEENLLRPEQVADTIIRILQQKRRSHAPLHIRKK